MKRANNSVAAFSILDLVLVVATLLVVAVIALSFLSKQNRARGHATARCRINLKQVGIGFRLYANDGDSYPSYSETNAAWEYFQKVGEEIGSPRILCCPLDIKRSTNPAMEFSLPATSKSFSDPSHRNSSLSYFYGADSQSDRPNLILAGDRSLSTNKAMLSEVTLKNTDSNLAWTKDLHEEGGNVVLGDGSVQAFTTKKLQAQIALRSNVVQRFVLP